MLVVTTAEIPGYRIEAVLGDVVGYGWGVVMVAGQRPPELLYRSRDQAVQAMWLQATQRGANAVVGHQLDVVPARDFSFLTCAIGTAVAVVPIPEGQPGATPQSIEDARQRSNSQSRPNPQPMPGQYSQTQQGFPPGVQSMPSAGYPSY